MSGTHLKRDKDPSKQEGKGLLSTVLLLSATLVIGIAIGIAIRPITTPTLLDSTAHPQTTQERATCTQVNLELQRSQSEYKQCLLDLANMQDAVAGLSANSEMFLEDLEKSIALKEEALVKQQEEVRKSEELRLKRAQT